jgi:hypothetical protein
MRNWFEVVPTPRRGMGWSAASWYNSIGQCSGEQSRLICAVPGADDGIVRGYCGTRGGPCTTTEGSAGFFHCCRPAVFGTTSAAPTGTTSGTGKGGSTTGTTSTTGTGKGGATTATGTGVCATQSRAGGSSYWRGVQTALCSRGFDPGIVDGVVGTNTRGAITRFQQSSGLTGSGRIDATTASALGVTAEAGQSSGGGGGRTTTPTTDPNTPSQTENAGFFSNFFNLRNPLFWLTLAGVATTVGGTAYYIHKRSKDRAGALAELSDTGLDRELAMVQAEQEQAAYEAKRIGSGKGRKK